MPALESYFPIAQAVSMLFYPLAEVVIHDLKTGQIAAIFNPLSKRKVGDESLIEDFENDPQFPDVFPVYSKINWDGRNMKSSTAVLRDKQGNPIGFFCINLDISKWEEMHHFLGEWLGKIRDHNQPEVLFKDDWREKINVYVSEYLKKEGVTLKSLNKEKQKELVKLLYQEGAFKAKHAASYAAEILNLSRATIYNYLRS